ncbi:MAG TPA: TIGR03621 family F420-dependent LLM class oxidoreductase [Kineosporiaceae bacterium]|nr:TIGR03621 family F420-dependent LLM class oxidoreductase [Kineosporiaceae bacterium]
MAADANAGTALTFGAGITAHHTRDEMLAAARTVEAAGFDVLNVADHLGNPSPFAVLAAAAAVTERVRLRSYVLNVYFWNSALLAREVATLDALSAGRFELGLGAGHMKREHDDAGLPFPPLVERVAELERVVVDVRRRLADSAYSPAPVQTPVPLSIGAWSDGSMRVAARHAEILSLTGMVQIKGKPPGTFDLSPVPEVDRRLERLRATLERERPAELPQPVLDCLVQRVVVDTDPEESAAALVAEYGDSYTVETVLESPFLLLAATPEDAVDELLRRQKRWGISSWCTHTASIPAFAEVVAAYRARVGAQR